MVEVKDIATQRHISTKTIMPLKGIPDSLSPELLFALARMGHGDKLVIADANFPSDSVAKHTVIGEPIRVQGLTTAELLKDILTLLPLDEYEPHPLTVMDRVPSDKQRDLPVPAYAALAQAASLSPDALLYADRWDFYEQAKKAFVVVQTTDRSLYANCIVSKGVL